MNFATMLLPLFFLMFLMMYQASPETYWETIDKTFNSIIESFEEKYSIGFESETATVETIISLFIKSALYSLFAIAILVVWLASIVPLPAETLIWLYIGLMIVTIIPWDIILGIILLAKDRWKKRKGRS